MGQTPRPRLAIHCRIAVWHPGRQRLLTGVANITWRDLFPLQAPAEPKPLQQVPGRGEPERGQEGNCSDPDRLQHHPTLALSWRSNDNESC